MGNITADIDRIKARNNNDKRSAYRIYNQTWLHKHKVLGCNETKTDQTYLAWRFVITRCIITIILLLLFLLSMLCAVHVYCASLCMSEWVSEWVVVSVCVAFVLTALLSKALEWWIHDSLLICLSFALSLSLFLALCECLCFTFSNG